MSKTDPLEQLFVSESQAVNKQELADLLLPYVSISKESKELDFSQSFRDLTNIDKIFILLAALKARSLVLKIDEKITPSDIIKMEIMPEGSTKGTLKLLLDSNEIKSERGKYYLPSYKIPQVVKRLKNYKSK